MPLIALFDLLCELVNALEDAGVDEYRLLRLDALIDQLVTLYLPRLQSELGDNDYEGLTLCPYCGGPFTLEDV